MAQQLADVIRVEGSVTGVFNSVRAQQVGFENEAQYRQIHKLADNTCHHWTPDEYRTMGATGVAYTNSNYPSYTNVQQALDQLLTVPLTVVNLSATTSYSDKGTTGVTNTINWGVTGSPTGLELIDAYNQPGWLDASDTSFSYPSGYTGIWGPTGVYTYTLAAHLGSVMAVRAVNLSLSLREYIGQSASSTPDETIIETALNGYSWLKSDVAASKTISSRRQVGGSKYVYIAYPAAWGALSTITVNGLVSVFNQTTVSITNAAGNTENYYCYTSPYTFAGTITIACS